jgi:anti-sigma factor RsiW
MGTGCRLDGRTGIAVPGAVDKGVEESDKIMSNSCEQRHLLLDLAAGRLSAEERAAVETHVAACSQCRTEMESLQSLHQALGRARKAMACDLSAEQAQSVLSEARLILKDRNAAVVCRINAIRRQARRNNLRSLWRQMLVPAAAAVVVFGIIALITRYSTPSAPQNATAIKRLYAQAKNIVTVQDIQQLQAVTRRSLDEAIAKTAPNVADVGHLQLIHYIAQHPRDPDQIDDIHFLLALLKANERREAQPVARIEPDFWDILASLENRAMAAPVAAEAPWLVEVRGLLLAGKYEQAYQKLSGADATRVHPLTAYAAIRAQRQKEAARVLEALTELERSESPLVSLLWAELALENQRYDTAIRHYTLAAKKESSLWFQAGYLCKYELGDETQAGAFFGRSGDPRIAAHVASRFQRDVSLARHEMPLLDQNFDTFPLGSVPKDWTLIPTHAGEYRIDQVDGSNVLRLNEIGYHGAKLCTGFPGWTNYTLVCDFKFLRRDQGASLQLAVYEIGITRYVLGLQDRSAVVINNRVNDNDTPASQRVTLPESIESGRWWRAEIRVENVDPSRTRLSATVWPREAERPAKPQVVWTDDAGAGGTPLQRGPVAMRVTEAEVAFDNISVTSNDITQP